MPTWTSWHLHLASPARSLADRVITDVIAPAVAVTGDRPWFFVRFWQGGPHVRLRVGDLAPPGAAALERDLARRLAVVGVPRPGEAPVDGDAYRAGAVRLAAAESGADRTVTPLRTSGVHLAWYQPETERYGGPGPLAGSEVLFRTSSELVVAALRRPRVAAARAAVALQATRAAAAALGRPSDDAVFYAHGVRAWREQAAAHGHPPEHLAVATRVERLRGLAEGHGPFAGWHAGLARLAGRVAAESDAHPGAVLASHVHMLHNRLGLTMLEELRTYALLAATFPAPAPLVGSAS